MPSYLVSAERKALVILILLYSKKYYEHDSDVATDCYKTRIESMIVIVMQVYMQWTLREDGKGGGSWTWGTARGVHNEIS